MISYQATSSALRSNKLHFISKKKVCQIHKMKTRSQAKKEKLEDEKLKIPKLNEDVLGILPTHVIEKHQVLTLLHFFQKFWRFLQARTSLLARKLEGRLTKKTIHPL